MADYPYGFNTDRLIALDPTRLVASSRIVGWWDLTETPGSNKADKSGNGYDLAEVGTTIVTEGVAGRLAFFVGGANGILQLNNPAHNVAFNLSEYTIMFWLKMVTSAGVRIIGQTKEPYTAAADEISWNITRYYEGTSNTPGVLLLYYNHLNFTKSPVSLPRHKWTFVVVVREEVAPGVFEDRTHVNGLPPPGTAWPTHGPSSPGANAMLTVGAASDGSLKSAMAMQDLCILDIPLTEVSVIAEARRIGALRA